MAFNPKWIVGKTVASVEMNPFPRGAKGSPDRAMAFNPTIRFTDGSAIAFVTDETEHGLYGTAIVYVKPPTKRRPR